MPDVPVHRKVKKVTHEWVIGQADRPTDAKTFRFGLHHVTTEMEELGIDLEYDDAYYVRAGDGGEIILFTEIKKEEK